MTRWTIQRRCCSRRPLAGARVADFPGFVYVFTIPIRAFTMADPAVHDGRSRRSRWPIPPFTIE
jgi:hypothetical protein